MKALESEDGRYLYYEKLHRDRPNEIWRMPFEGGEANLVLERLRREKTWDLWRQFLIYLEPKGEEGPSIDSLDLETGEVTTLVWLGGDGRVMSEMSVSPDGQWIVYPNRDAEGSDLLLIENFFELLRESTGTD